MRVHLVMPIVRDAGNRIDLDEESITETKNLEWKIENAHCVAFENMRTIAPCEQKTSKRPFVHPKIRHSISNRPCDVESATQNFEPFVGAIDGESFLQYSLSQWPLLRPPRNRSTNPPGRTWHPLPPLSACDYPDMERLGTHHPDAHPSFQHP